MKSPLCLATPLRRAISVPPAWGTTRCLSTTPPTWSGHSKWATIKHDKGKNDAARSKVRMAVTKDISNAVKLGGPNPTMNPRLALALEKAKKSSIPKANIEAAIARGQGLSASGAALENLTLEAILPANVAAVIECQTDTKLKTLADLRIRVKDAGGNVTPVNYLFEKKGRIIFEKKDGVSVDEVFEPALDAGALDVGEDEEGRVVVWTEPAQITTTTETLSKQLDLGVEESEIIWDPNEDTKVPVDDEEAVKALYDFIDEVQEVQGVMSINMNWKQGKCSDEMWAELLGKVQV